MRHFLTICMFPSKVYNVEIGIRYSITHIIRSFFSVYNRIKPRTYKMKSDAPCEVTKYRFLLYVRVKMYTKIGNINEHYVFLDMSNVYESVK